MAVDYKLTGPSPIGAPPLNVSGDLTQRIQLGTRVKGVDQSSAAYGEAEFEYVKFTGIVAAGDNTLLNGQAKTGVICPAAATKGKFGISMAAQVANSYGYVMVKGIHDDVAMLTGAAVAYGPTYQSAITAGKITDAVTANAILERCAIRVTGANSRGCVEITYPECSGR
jgi:hypothetical protein